MAFLLKRTQAGRYSGQHRSPLKGQSVEFADYRSYTVGDDFRQVDWHAYARLDRLFIKLFMEETDLLIHILIDTSASMAGTKLKLAQQLAGALGYLALVNTERVSVMALSNGSAKNFPVQRGRASVGRFWSFLEQLEPGGDTKLDSALRQAGKFVKGQGMTILLSDLLSPQGFSEGLKYLQYLNQQVVVMQILEPGDRDPGLLGNFRLVDCESGEAKEVSITPLILQKYRQRLEDFLSGIRQFCLSREIAYHTVGSEDNLEDILLRSLRSVGVLT